MSTKKVVEGWASSGQNPRKGHTSTAEQRVAALQDICNQIAHGIHSARTVLRNNAEDPEVANLVADSLDRLGWMADKATQIAEPRTVLVAGDIQNWVFSESVQELIQEIAGEES